MARRHFINSSYVFVIKGFTVHYKEAQLRSINNLQKSSKMAHEQDNGAFYLFIPNRSENFPIQENLRKKLTNFLKLDKKVKT